MTATLELPDRKHKGRPPAIPDFGTLDRMDQERPELTAEMVVHGRIPSMPALSPDGRWIAFVVTPLGRTGEHPLSELWVTAADGTEAPRQLAVPPGRVSSPLWAPDSAAVYFLSDHGAPGKSQLFRIHDDSVQALTDWASGIDSYRLLADAGQIALMSADKPTDVVRQRAENRDDAYLRTQTQPARLRILDLKTGEIRTPDLLGGRHVVDVVQRPDGGPLAVLTWSSPEPDPGLLQPVLYLLDLPTGEVHDTARLPADAQSPVWWDSHGWHLAYLALTPPGLQAGNAVFDVAVPDTCFSGAHRNLTSGLPACPAELAPGDHSGPLVLVDEGLDTVIHRLIPGEFRMTEVSRITGHATQLVTARESEVVAAVISRPEEPHNIYAGPAGQPLLRRTDTRPELRDIRWGEQRRLRYHAADGLELDGLLILPAGRASHDGPFPLVTIVHGGPYDRYPDGFMLSWALPGQWFAQAGYAVFLPNPRGGKGHGHQFAAGVAGAVGQDEWTDILTGINTLIDDGVADPDRLGIGGWSHGGFMAAWAIGQTDRFAAAIMGAGISDWGMLAATGEFGIFEAALGGSVGWEGPGPHRHDQLSPISYASSVRTPVLIVHGAEDTNVPISQAEYFHRALRHFGAEHEFVVYPRENHSFREANHQLDLLHRTRAWFDRWLAV